ncbi:MAG: hypothetical protein ACLRM9_01205 [Collinsella aerofaciens]
MEQFIGDLHNRPTTSPASPWLWTPLPVSSRLRSLRTTSTPSSRRLASRTSRLPRLSSSPMAACLLSASPSVAKAVDHLVENAKVTEVDETAKDAE